MVDIDLYKIMALSLLWSCKTEMFQAENYGSAEQQS